MKVPATGRVGRNSFIDSNYPGARVTDATGQPRFFRGSGTSQAAAVISGSVALLLQQRPKLTPDEVKGLLVQTADPLPGADPVSTGAGQLDIAEAAALAAPSDKAKQKFASATGLGTLQGARGASYVTDSVTGIALLGEKDIFGKPWAAAIWASNAKSGKAWTGGTWNGTAWVGPGFTGTSWATRTWATATWSSNMWTGRSRSGSTWTGRSWSAGVWTGRSWSAGTWTGRSWSGRSWS
ncbi:S8 family serine peptidase [Actinoplanes sp. NPDC048791]|uniref:S8 family serine peptidase n=1 Tax=Actinoplanes sp. NPDC048791 TaxID=3154623 RepID=UPI0033DC047B